jgi:TonB-dependent SusC/RagA subfamily outer membrane receptor
MKKFVAICTGILLSASLWGQNKVVHGEITVFNRYPVRNVEVTAKKAKSTITTDSLGQFNIVCFENDVIQIKPKTFQATSKRVNPDTDSLIINLIFIDSKANRDKAVGYGYINEADLIYAVNHLEQENNNFCSYNTIFDLIQGQLAGVTVSGGQVFIRSGKNSFSGPSNALTVVDGVPSESIEWISPCQVKSIDVLKDSNAAIYGARGGNGVVLIELKK